MANKSASVKCVCTLPDPVVSGQALTATCSMDIHGQTMFVLKSKGSGSDGKKYPISILKVSKYTTSPKVSTITVKKNGKEYGAKCIHANGLCYARKEGDSKGSLFVSTGNAKDKPQILKMNTSGTIEKECRVYKGGTLQKITTLTYYGMINGKMCFIMTNGSSDGRPRYRFFEFDGSNFYDTPYCFYGVATPDDYSRNDITYANGILYQTMFKKVSGKIKYNRVYAYDISKFLPEQLRGQDISTYDIIQCNATKDYDKKFEIEAVIEYSNTLYCATNAESSNASKNKDTIFKMKIS